ncbi:MAG: hypothetical protein WCW78_03985 [Candidatus Paceibacterota bacterium]|jgi:hypothetical protein
MKKIGIVVFVLAAATLVLGLGYYLGDKRGTENGSAEAEKKYAPIVDTAYPKPPDIIKDTTGVVKGIYGTILSVEVYDPSDYLPHTDGTPQKKMLIAANTTSQTKYTVLSITDSAPRPAKFSDITVGDSVGIKSNGNMRGVTQFDAVLVELIK